MWYHEKERRGIGLERGIRRVYIIKSLHSNLFLCATGVKHRTIISTLPTSFAHKVVNR